MTEQAASAQTSRRLDDRVALITGATSGIGEATAVAMAREGASVLVSGLNRERGDAVVDRIVDEGGRATFFAADVTDAEQVEGLVATAVDTYGRLDIAFNNAGIGNLGELLHEYPDDLWQRTIDVNVKGVWLGMKYQLTQMLRQSPLLPTPHLPPSRGAIVNMSSIAGLVATASSGYCASKHAVIGLTKSASLIYADQGIRINAVCPAGIETPMLERAADANPDKIDEWRAEHPIGRIGRPEEVADAVLWLSSDGAQFVTGSSLVIDGGWTAG